MKDDEKQLIKWVESSNSFQKQALDTIAENNLLIDALENMIDGANVWDNHGRCHYCYSPNHKDDCEYKAAVLLLYKVKKRNEPF